MAGSLEANKIIGAVLTGGIIVVGAGVLGDLLYHPKTVAENAFPIAVGDATDVAEEEIIAVPLPVLLASASAEDGQGAFRACAACHTHEEGGANRVGPNLWGVLGADIAAHDGFSYSDALAGKEGEWTYEHMYEFLKAPAAWAPGTSMSYAGIREAEDRANMIAYLRSLSNDPLPLPEPEEAAATPEEAAPDEAAPAGDAEAAPAGDAEAAPAGDAEAAPDGTEPAPDGVEPADGSTTTEG